MSFTVSIIEDAALEWLGELGHAVAPGMEQGPGLRRTRTNEGRVGDAGYGGGWGGSFRPLFGFFGSRFHRGEADDEDEEEDEDEDE